MSDAETKRSCWKLHECSSGRGVYSLGMIQGSDTFAWEVPGCEQFIVGINASLTACKYLEKHSYLKDT